MRLGAGEQDREARQFPGAVCRGIATGPNHVFPRGGVARVGGGKPGVSVNHGVAGVLQHSGHHAMLRSEEEPRVQKRPRF